MKDRQATDKQASEKANADAGVDRSSAESVTEPEPALKVIVERNTEQHAPFINSMSLARGDTFELVVFDATETRFELSIDDAKQAIEPQRVEIPQGEGKSPVVKYISGLVVAPDSPVKLK